MSTYGRRLLKALLTMSLTGFLAGAAAGSVAGATVAVLDGATTSAPSVHAWVAILISVLTGILSGGVTIGLTFGRLKALEDWRKEHMDDGVKRAAIIDGKASKQDLAEAVAAMRASQSTVVETINTRFDDLRDLVNMLAERRFVPR